MPSGTQSRHGPPPVRARSRRRRGTSAACHRPFEAPGAYVLYSVSSSFRDGISGEGES